MHDIDHYQIRSKLIKYLELKKGSQNDDLTSIYNTKEINNIIDHLKTGHCHGFAVSYSAFGFSKKLTWWSHLLRSIINWDETSESLPNEIKLEGQIEQKTLEQLIIIAINAIRFNHIPSVMYDENTVRDGNMQLDLFSPSLKFFELMLDNQIMTVKDRALCPGNIDKITFNTLIINGINSSLILLRTMDHACSIRVDQGKYYFYDPYSHDRIYEKEYTSIDALYNGISTSLSPTFSIDFISFYEQNNLEHVKQIYDQSLSIEMLRNDGLGIIAQQTPEKLQAFIDLINTDEQKIIVAKILCDQTKHKFSGWMAVACYAPNSLQKFIDMLSTAEHKNNFITTLCSQVKDGWTGWMILAVYAPNSLQSLIDMVSTSEQKDIIISALCRKNTIDWTGWMALAHYTPDKLQPFIDMITTSDQKKQVSDTHYQKDKSQKTSFEIAKELKISKIIDLLEVVNNIQDRKGNTPLHYALMEGNNYTAKKLILEGIPLLKNHDGITPFKIALEKANYEMIPILYKNGDMSQKDIEAISKQELTEILFDAIDARNNDLVKFLLENNKELFTEEDIAIQLFLSSNTDLLNFLISNSYTSINSLKEIIEGISNEWGYTILHVILDDEKDLDRICQIIEWMCEHKLLDFSKKDKEKDTLLYLAVRLSDEKIVRLLIENGYHVGEDEKRKILAQALESDNSELISLISNHIGNISIHDVVNNRDDRLLRSLIKRQSNELNSFNQNKETALHIAIRLNDLEMIKLLVQANANVDIKNADGLTVIDIAAGKGDEELVSILTKDKSDTIKSRAKQVLSFRNEFMQVISNGDPESISKLLNDNADIPIQSISMISAIILYNSCSLFEYFIDQKYISINFIKQDWSELPELMDGCNILDLIFECFKDIKDLKKLTEQIELICKYDLLNLSAIDDKGKTIIDRAKEKYSDNNDIVILLNTMQKLGYTSKTPEHITYNKSLESLLDATPVADQ
ncbi:ankyrin repeat domain-containing protein [Thiotrichales bacterium 19S9-12]|nr:ankyrin repeat domain-containing protein [Thiotrichales bacterium 19S9-11]MCF6811274.1 ankyrin repeat domain-containing protein [Thiotrichales bacterium 19S9-12]